MNLLEPTTPEINAVERVLHEALSDTGLGGPDSYFRALSRAVLEAAKEAEFNQFLADLNREELDAAGRRALFDREVGDAA